MPEGPEIRLSSIFINGIASEHTFSGKVVKGEKATKLDEVPFESDSYTISAESRGKELKLHLTDVSSKKRKNQPENYVNHLLFRFGMSGCFKFTKNEEEEIPKHAHLRFITKDRQNMLSFVDYRRFGKWEINGEWGKDRGPDPISHYEEFRSNILKNLDDTAFDRPICEAMLNQKFFNGIGNYLRAEILYRCSIPPFNKARDSLSKLNPVEEKIEFECASNVEKIKVENNKFDILQLCNIVPNEVLNLPTGKGYDVDPNSENDDIFTNWLQCYAKYGMNNLVDKNGRTIWFYGPAGALKPSNAKSRGSKTNRRPKAANPKSLQNGNNPEIKEKQTTPIIISSIKTEALYYNTASKTAPIRRETAATLKTAEKLKLESEKIQPDSGNAEIAKNIHTVATKRKCKKKKLKFEM